MQPLQPPNKPIQRPPLRAAWAASNNNMIHKEQIVTSLVGLVSGPFVFVGLLFAGALASSIQLQPPVVFGLGAVVLGWRWPLFAVSTGLGGIGGGILILCVFGEPHLSTRETASIVLQLGLPYLIGSALGILLGGSSRQLHRSR